MLARGDSFAPDKLNDFFISCEKMNYCLGDTENILWFGDVHSLSIIIISQCRDI